AWCASTDGSASMGLQLTAALGRFWYVVGRLSEGIGWIERFAAAPPAVGLEADPRVAALRATPLHHGAMLAAEAGRYRQAAAWGAESEAIWTDLGDQLGAA